MKSLWRCFVRHPASVGESYFQHMATALGFGFWMGVAALAALVHAVLPFLCERTGSRIVGRLHHRMVVARDARLQRTPGE